MSHWRRNQPVRAPKHLRWIRSRVPLLGQGGYALIELIVAMTIFALISIVVLGALVTVMQSSAKTGAERRVQQDARYSIEEIARQTRSASIDYDFYTKNAADPRCAFSPAGSNSTRALALIFSEASEAETLLVERVVFFYDPADGGAVYRYESSLATLAPTCAEIFGAPVDADTGPTKSKITSGGVSIPSATFFVSPNQDPYDPSDCASPPCNVARNTHPRVTILLTARTTGSGVGVSEQSRTGAATIQTTVGSRAYQADTLLGQPGAEAAPSPTPTPVPSPTAPSLQTINGRDFTSCQVAGSPNYCQISGTSVYSLSGGNGNPNFVVAYRFSGLPAGSYRLTLNYFNFQFSQLNPPPGYGSYRITISDPGGSRTVQLPIESTSASQNPHTYTLHGLNLPANPLITLTWDNDNWTNGDANFGLNWARLTAN